VHRLRQPLQGGGGQERIDDCLDAIEALSCAELGNTPLVCR
jgi:hypothetical protein